MVSTNKILTVSYGTFSCTLEGFEDSFGTMKAIAEYFRDLAADDRYFGAEPPQPDAELLARIAGKEASRMVEAHRSETGIVLRAADYQPGLDTAAAPAERNTQQEPAVAAAPAPTARPDGPPAEAGDNPADSESVMSAEPVGAYDPEDVTESSAPTEEEIADIAWAETESDAATAWMEADVTDAGEHAEPEAEETPALAAETVEENEEEAAMEILEDPAGDDAQWEDEPPVEASEDAATSSVISRIMGAAAHSSAAEAAVTTGRDTGNDEESIAAKLSRIRAVVAQHKLDDDAEDGATASASLVDDEDLTATEDETSPELAEVFANFEDDETAGSDELTAAEAQYEDDEDWTEPANILADVEDDHTGMASDDDDFEDDGIDGPTAGLSQEDEDELARELAEVESEFAQSDAAEPETSARPARKPMLLEQTSRYFEDDDASGRSGKDEDVSRLMAAAERKMDDADNSSNRATYSQLRGAVAAAEAERSAGGNVNDDSSDGDYRADLASVVRPRRQAPRPRSGERPEDTRPAPLRLVAEQRIDLDPETPPAPVRPRRVSAEDVGGGDATSEADDDSGFVEFAREAGATELPDLLEAAAAYLSFVEGREQFSRPQLMGKVRQLKNQEFKREDGLRSFGLLLRQGKIEKTVGGRFTASDGIGFRPDEREAG